MATSIIKEVAVYRNGCFVTRRGTVSLKSGKQTILIEKLPNTLDASTVRFSLPSKVIGSNVQVEALTKEEKAALLKPYNDRVARLENRIEAKNTQIQMWNANADFSAKESLSIVDMADYIEKLPERLEKIYQEIEELNTEKEEANKQLKEKNIESRCLNIRVDMETEAEGEYPFELRYFDSNASWGPIYEIHTDEADEESLTLKLKARIAQRTTEDWKQVKVRLFTGDPAVSGTIPTLYPNRLSYFVQESRRNYMAGMAMAAPMAKMAMADAAVEMEVEDGMAYEEEEMPLNDIAEMQAAVKQNDTMMEYELSGLWDIGKENDIKADISSNKVGCRYHIVAIPKLADTGYLAAEVKTKDIEEILNSNAIIYHKGAYLGEAALNADMTKPTYDISLGKDESIKLKREQKKRYSSTVLLKGTRKTEFEYEIKVVSSKNKACNVTMLDQIPVSSDKTIVIEQTELTGGKLTESNGEVKWEFELQPSETKTFALNYNVSWPKDKNVIL